MRFWRLRRMLVRLIKREGYDVLHAHARFPALLLRGMQRLGARTVVTVHAAFAHNRRLSHVCYWGEKTVAVSEDLRLYVTDHYPVPATQVSVIRNGIDTVFVNTSIVDITETGYFNFHLDSLSYARDCGSTSVSTLYPLDLDANPRNTDGKPDLGAYER
jgi:hypothetical protein